MKRIIMILGIVVLIGIVTAGAISLTPVPDRIKEESEIKLRQFYNNSEITKMEYINELSISESNFTLYYNKSKQTVTEVPDGRIVRQEYKQNSLSPSVRTKVVYRVG